MALLQDYRGRDDSNPGRWYSFRRDPDTGELAEIRVRVPGQETRARLRRRYEKPVPTEVRGKTVMRPGLPPEDIPKLGMDALAWMLVDVRNFEVAAFSDEALAFYATELQQPHLAGRMTFRLDGKLTDALRRRILEEVPGLAEAVNQVGQGDQQPISEDDGAAWEDALARNLPSGSSSSSATRPSRGEASVAEPVGLSEETASHA